LNKEVFKNHEIKGLNVKVYYPTEEQYQVIIEKLLLSNLKYGESCIYFDLGEYEVSEFLIPLITNLDIENKLAKKELKRMIIKGDTVIQPLINSLKNILQIATQKFTEETNNNINQDNL